jgi:hypothetical protein
MEVLQYGSGCYMVQITTGQGNRRLLPVKMR